MKNSKNRINLKRNLIALMVAGGVTVGGLTLVKSTNEQHIIDEDPQTTQSLNEDDSKQDLQFSTAILNIRLGSNTSSFVIGMLPSNTVVKRILVEGNWSLIEYNGIIGYVTNDYLKEYDIYEDINEEYTFEKDNDIVRTTKESGLKSTPSSDKDTIIQLEKDEEAIVIGKTYNKKTKEEWLLVKVRGKIGYVNKNDTKSLKEIIKEINPDLEKVKIKKLGYLNKETQIYGNSGEKIATKDQYELVEVLDQIDDKLLVNIDGTIGFIDGTSLIEIKGSFIAVDLSTQRIYYYCDNDIAFKGKCTTGKESSPTEVGFFRPTYKHKGHNFGPKHNYVESKILWEPFNDGQGLHDAPWQKEETFGDPDYDEKHGSAGCVRLPDDVAEFIFNETTLDDMILIKK